jgi:hypothetical protein
MDDNKPCACKKPQPKGKGMGVPGGMIKVTEHVIVSVPFPRQVVNVTEVKSGLLQRKAAVRYFFGGSWVDADTLLARWPDWRDEVVKAFGPTRTDNVATAV